MEILDIVDEYGNPTGKTAEREIVHRRGLFHRTSHLWVLRRRGDTLQLLLQKRSEDKDSFPGCFDISSAGHIPAGHDFVPSAIRELKEELGLCARPEELIYLGTRKIVDDRVFHGAPFHDRQISRVYAIFRDIEAENINFQRAEIQEVEWQSLDFCRNMVSSGTPANCVSMEEIKMIENRFVYEHKTS